MKFISRLMPREGRFFTLFNDHAGHVRDGGVAMVDLLANSQSFFSPTLSTSVTVTHSLFSNSSSFFTARVGQDVAPAAISNSQSFYAPTVAATYQIEPLLIESQMVFHAPVVMQPFDIELLPALLASENHIIRPELRRFNPLPRRSRDRYAAREYVGR